MSRLRNARKTAAAHCRHAAPTWKVFFCLSLKKNLRKQLFAPEIMKIGYRWPLGQQLPGKPAHDEPSAVIRNYLVWNLLPWKNSIQFQITVVKYCSNLIPVTLNSVSGVFGIPMVCEYSWNWWLNTLRPTQNGRHFPDGIFKCIFLNENVWISIKISLKFASKGPINNIPALVQIMAWRWPGHNPLSEPTLVSLLTHICITRPPWVNAKEM